MSLIIANIRYKTHSDQKSMTFHQFRNFAQQPLLLKAHRKPEIARNSTPLIYRSIII